MDEYEDMLRALDNDEIAALFAEIEEASKGVGDEIARSLEGFEADAMSYDIPL